MQGNAQNIKRGVAVFTVLFILLAVGLLVYNTLVFRVTRTTPDPAEFPTVAPYVDIYFSKPVDIVESYALNDEVTGSISLHENRVRYTPASIYEDGSQYSLQLSGVRSKSGDKMDYTYDFTAVYMNFSAIPEEIQRASIEKSSSGQIDDPFFNNYFPMQTADFQIEHPFDKNSTDNKKILYVTFMREVMNYDTGVRYTLPDEEAEALRTKTIEYIEKHGGKPNDYTTTYANEYLQNKYGKNNHGY